MSNISDSLDEGRITFGPSTQANEEVRDPVCGMMVHAKDAPAASLYRSQTFRFCSERCKHEFDRDPVKYAG